MLEQVVRPQHVGFAEPQFEEQLTQLAKGNLIIHHDAPLRVLRIIQVRAQIHNVLFCLIHTLARRTSTASAQRAVLVAGETGPVPQWVRTLRFAERCSEPRVGRLDQNRTTNTPPSVTMRA
jgi:hypothetical protein